MFKNVFKGTKLRIVLKCQKIIVLYTSTYLIYIDKNFTLQDLKKELTFEKLKACNSMKHVDKERFDEGAIYLLKKPGYSRILRIPTRL